MILFFLTVSGFAQDPPNDPLKKYVFPPGLVMQNQTALNLTPEQAAAILSQIQDVQSKFTGVQWKLQGELERLTRLLAGTNADEEQVLAQLDKILDLERQIKRTHLALAVRIKNQLTAEQQATLARISHGLSATGPGSSALTALRSVGLLDVPYSTPAGTSVARLVRTALPTPRPDTP